MNAIAGILDPFFLVVVVVEVLGVVAFLQDTHTLSSLSHLLTHIHLKYARSIQNTHTPSILTYYS